MRLAIAQPCFGSRAMVFRINKSSVPWIRSDGLPITYTPKPFTKLLDAGPVNWLAEESFVFRTVFVSTVCALALAAQQQPASPAKGQKPVPDQTHPAPIPQQKPAASPAKESPLRFDIRAMDKTADPCSDFFQFACGSW